MNEKIKFIEKELDSLIPNPEPALHFQDPFTLLVAVMLSAQCTDERVNKVTPILFKLANTPKKMAALPLATLEKTIHSLGFFRMKSKNLKALSQKILDNFQGEVPTNLHDLETLPGVGHKTASVVMTQAFHHPAFPVDTHIHRLAKRWGLSSGKNVVQTEEDLKKLFPEKDWAKVHLQMVLFGRKYCPARAHNPEACPICSKI